MLFWWKMRGFRISIFRNFQELSRKNLFFIEHPSHLPIFQQNEHLVKIFHYFSSAFFRTEVEAFLLGFLVSIGIFRALITRVNLTGTLQNRPKKAEIKLSQK
jgi:hypothetical protein